MQGAVCKSTSILGKATAIHQSVTGRFFRVGNHIKDATGYGDPTMWGPQDSVQLVYNSNYYGITMVYGTYITSYNYSYWGESKPTNITFGGPTYSMIHDPSDDPSDDPSFGGGFTPPASLAMSVSSISSQSLPQGTNDLGGIGSLWTLFHAIGDSSHFQPPQNGPNGPKTMLKKRGTSAGRSFRESHGNCTGNCHSPALKTFVDLLDLSTLLHSRHDSRHLPWVKHLPQASGSCIMSEVLSYV